MERPHKHANDEDLGLYTMSEKYHLIPIYEGEEEIDVDCLGLSSNS